MSENPLLRARITEIGAKLAAARYARDILHASPSTPGRDERIRSIDLEIAILNDRMRAIVGQLVAE